MVCGYPDAMRSRVRWASVAAISVGTAIGPASCSESMDLDPANRVIYDGDHLTQAVECSEQSFDLARELGRPRNDVIINAVADQITVNDADSPDLRIRGTTDFRFPSGHILVRWECVKKLDEPQFRTDLTYEIVEKERD
jgi:hypothetical protein